MYAVFEIIPGEPKRVLEVYPSLELARKKAAQYNAVGDYSYVALNLYFFKEMIDEF